MRAKTLPPIPAFIGVPEAFIDEVLDHLEASARLPIRCFAFGSDMQLLGVLCEQWKGKIEIVAVFGADATTDMLDAACLIVESEGFRADSILWVCSTSTVQLLAPDWRVSAVSEKTTPKAVAQTIVDELAAGDCH